MPFDGRWLGLPAAIKRVARTCLKNGMRFNSGGLARREIARLLAGTPENDVKNGIQQLIGLGVLVNEDAHGQIHFSFQGERWAESLLAEQVEDQQAGLGAINPGGPSNEDFPWAVPAPTDAKWRLGRYFEKKFTRDGNTRKQLIKAMSKALFDPTSGTRKDRAWHGLFGTHIDHNLRLLWHPDCGGSGTLVFVFLGSHEDPKYDDGYEFNCNE